MQSVRSLAALSIMIAVPSLVTGCSSDEDPAQPEPAKTDYTIDTFNIALAGAFIPFEQERRAPLVQALASSESDFVCLQEVWRESDKELIASGVASTFPHVVRFQHGLDTAVDDPTDQQGNVPAAATTPPCGEPSTQEKLDKIIACLAENCSTQPGSLDGQTTSTSCAEQNCTIEAIALLTGTDDDKRCYGCAATSLPVSSLAAIKTACTTDPNAGLAFDGQSGVMLLSKHPVTRSDDLVIPGTWNRRVILSASVQLPSGAEVDVYCNHLSPVFSGITYPYSGAYGDGKTGEEGWAAEQLLQAQKLIAHVATMSANRPAVILGDFNSGHAYNEGQAGGFHAEAEATISLLESQFTAALVPGFTPKCTHCADNANVNKADTSDSVWIDHIFLANLPAEAIQHSMRTYDEPVVDVTVEGAPSQVPLSDHYGLRSVVTIVP